MFLKPDKAGEAKSRKASIMSDACEILIQQPTCYSGNFVLDEIILRMQGVTNFDKYRVNPQGKEDELMMDFFLPDNYYTTQTVPPKQILISKAHL
jgi:citronellol/citronellal dehydrogenase